MMDRRKFLIILSSTVGLVVSAGSPFASAARNYKLGTLKKTYVFFTPTEAMFVEAAVARLIPADKLGPGALEADVSYYIDQQLAGEYGAGARFYNEGPFGAKTPFQGYQLPLSPRELYRAGIAATDRYCQEMHGKPFADLSSAQQDEVLHGLEAMAGDKDLQEVPGATFFAYLLGDTKDGFFSDPAYGGNRDMIGWKLIGFPGVPAMYNRSIGQNTPYSVEPVDMRGALGDTVAHDHHGHVIHRVAAPRPTLPPSLQEGESEETHDWKPGSSFTV
jgi:gluconate 2-dehydrogenase gamma chain